MGVLRRGKALLKNFALLIFFWGGGGNSTHFEKKIRIHIFDKLSIYLAWYDKAAQPQNMTISHCTLLG